MTKSLLMKDKYFENASWSGLSTGIKLIAGMVNILLAIKLIGAEAFGHLASWLSLFTFYLALNISVYVVLVIDLMRKHTLQAEIIRGTAIVFSVFSLMILFILTGILAILNHKYYFSIDEPSMDLVIIMLGGLISVQIVANLQSAFIEGSGHLALAMKAQIAGPLVTMLVLLSFYFYSVQAGILLYTSLLCLASFIDLLLLWFIRRSLGLSASLNGQRAGHIFTLLRSGGLLQGASMLTLILDPVNKWLLNSYAGASTVALYEFAIKLILGIQHLIGAAMRVFLHIGSQDKESIGRTFVSTVRLLAVPVMVMHIVSLIILSLAAQFWLFVDGQALIIFASLVTISNIAMIFSTPLYMGLVGQHDLRFIFTVKFFIISINIALSCVFVPIFGLLGVALSFLIAELISATSIFLRSKIQKSLFKDFLKDNMRIPFSVSLLIVVTLWLIYNELAIQPLIIFVCFLAFIMGCEPLIHRLFRQFIPVRKK